MPNRTHFTSWFRERFRTGLLLLLVVFGGCAVNPVTGERQLALISEAQEIEMGRQAAQEVEQSLGLVPDEALQAYVQRIGAQMAAISERPNLPWSFGVVDDPTPNAFALPGGYIFVTRGMMDLMDSEAELASVLGHEIGHVTARHSVTRISRAQLAQLGLGLGTVLFPQLEPFGGLASGGLSLLFLKHGRDAERQADELGFKYARSEGYDVREMADVFASLQRIGELEGQSSLPSWLASHPAPAERIESVQERIAQMEPSPDTALLGRTRYLKRIEGLAYGANPRNGFFQDGVFFHPELRFRLEFPTGWKTQNMAQAVMAGSPEQDALVQLTLAAQNSATEATNQFLSQQGVQPAGSTREVVNGNPAVVSYFQAQTQQGTVQGLVTHLEYEGRVYQLLSYAPAARFSRYDRLFQQIVRTFAPLTDPQVLGIQPQRIAIVRLDERMSLTEFNRRYPSEIPLEELAILNQVTDVNRSIAAGTLLKRIVRSE